MSTGSCAPAAAGALLAEGTALLEASGVSEAGLNCGWLLASVLRSDRLSMLADRGLVVPPGEVKKFSAGGALLAEKTGFPVIPVAHNAGRCWSRNSFLKYPGVITVKIGPAIACQGKKAIAELC